MVTVISLFAGCGGSSLGYKWAGFKELLAIEWKQNAVDTFRLNFPDVPVLQKDISRLSGQEILKFCQIEREELDILDGSPPCQGFSTAGKRIVSDSRNDLFGHNIRLIGEIEPKVFVIENVSGMIKGKMKGRFKDYMRQLKGLPYRVKCKLMNAKYYDVPQSRQRLIWIGVKKDLEIEPSYPESNAKLITVREALNGTINEIKLEPLSKYRFFMDSLKPGQNLSKIYGNSFYSYVRLPKNRPAMTITKSVCFGKVSMWHFEESRNISIEESKRLQTFSDNFILKGSYAEQWALIGNSVPPKMMKAIAGHIKKELLEKAELIKQ